MLGWMVKSGLLSVRVGVMRQGEGIVHGKFGIIYDSDGKAVVFNGSGNESAQGLRANYERLEVSTSWQDEERFFEYQGEFENLWNDTHPHVHTVSLPEAVKQKLISSRRKSRLSLNPRTHWRAQGGNGLAICSPRHLFLEAGASTCEATAPIELWPHQRVSSMSPLWSGLTDACSAMRLAWARPSRHHGLTSPPRG